MENLLLRLGGRPFAYDDVQVLQDLALAGQQVLTGLGNCVVSGCQLTPAGSGFDVASGVLWLDGELRDFPGRAGVALPALFQPGVEVLSDPRIHTLSGDNLPCLREQNAELVDYDPANPPARLPLLLTANGPLYWWKRVEEKQRKLAEILWVANLSASSYDAQGRGVGDYWGWALADGRGGTSNLSDRFIVARNAANPDTDTVGKTGGESKHTLTLAELPRHRLRIASKKVDSAVKNPDYSTIVAGASGAAANGPAADSNFTEYVGGDQPFDNRPRFYVLAAWQWVGF